MAQGARCSLRCPVLTIGDDPPSPGEVVKLIFAGPPIRSDREYKLISRVEAGKRGKKWSDGITGRRLPTAADNLST